MALGLRRRVHLHWNRPRRHRSFHGRDSIRQTHTPGTTATEPWTSLSNRDPYRNHRHENVQIPSFMVHLCGGGFYDRMEACCSPALSLRIGRIWFWDWNQCG
jgi:hypothetical protein